MSTFRLLEGGTDRRLLEDGTDVRLLEGEQPQVDLSFLQAAASTADLTTYTFSSQNLGTADADRYIVVGILSRGLGSGVTVSSVTIGGVAATIVVQRENPASNSNIAAIAIAAVPTGTTGDVVVTFSTGRLRCSIQMYRLVNINDPTPGDTGTSIATDPTTSLDIPEGGVGIGCGIENNAAGSAAWTGLTEDHDSTLEGNNTVTSASASVLGAVLGRTVTINFSASGAPVPVGVFASWGAVAATGEVAAPAIRRLSLTKYNRPLEIGREGTVII